MLDSYIIEKLREERERTHTFQIPLHIEPPRPPREWEYEERRRREAEQENGERQGGVLIIDMYGDNSTSVY